MSFRRNAGLILCLGSVALPLSAQPKRAEYQNPIIFADYSDPDVARVGDTYYLAASSFHFSPGLPILKSTDLVHWTIVGHVLPKLTFAPEYDMVGPFTLTDTTVRPVGPGLRYGRGVWAPAIRYRGGLFYVYFPTPDEGIFLSTAKHAEGPWSTPIKVIGGPGLEDPAPFWDDDGLAYLIHSRTGAGPLILHRMSADGTTSLDAGETIVEDKLNLPTLEGPKLYKRNGWYYIFAPIGGVDRGPQVVLRSRNIRGPYESRVVLEKGDTEVQAPHQGAYVETPSGEGWFVHFNSTGAFGRITYLEPVRWVDDWPVMGIPIPGKVSGQPVGSYPMPEGKASAVTRVQDSDEFTSRTLGVQWEWNHNPVDGNWSLRERPGFLRLRALPAADLVTARNTLTQILQGPQSQVTTRLDIRNMVQGQRTGLSVFGVRPSWIGVAHDGTSRHLVYSSAGVETLGPVVTEASIELRAEVARDESVRYSYSLNGGRTYSRFGDVATMRFGWWKGGRPAVFTYLKGAHAGAAGGGWVDVDWVRVKAGSATFKARD